LYFPWALTLADAEYQKRLVAVVERPTPVLWHDPASVLKQARADVRELRKTFGKVCQCDRDSGIVARPRVCLLLPVVVAPA
jgi:hypothetical protein